MFVVTLVMMGMLMMSRWLRPKPGFLMLVFCNYTNECLKLCWAQDFLHFQGKAGISGSTGERGPHGEPVSMLSSDCCIDVVVLGNWKQNTQCECRTVWKSVMTVGDRLHGGRIIARKGFVRKRLSWSEWLNKHFRGSDVDYCHWLHSLRVPLNLSHLKAPLPVPPILD